MYICTNLFLINLKLCFRIETDARNLHANVFQSKSFLSFIIVTCKLEKTYDKLFDIQTLFGYSNIIYYALIITRNKI